MKQSKRTTVLITIILILALIAAIGTATYAWFRNSASLDTDVIPVPAYGGTYLEFSPMVETKLGSLYPAKLNPDAFLNNSGLWTSSDIIAPAGIASHEYRLNLYTGGEVVGRAPLSVTFEAKIKGAASQRNLVAEGELSVDVMFSADGYILYFANDGIYYRGACKENLPFEPENASMNVKLGTNDVIYLKNEGRVAVRSTMAAYNADPAEDKELLFFDGHLQIRPNDNPYAPANVWVKVSAQLTQPDLVCAPDLHGRLITIGLVLTVGQQ